VVVVAVLVMVVGAMGDVSSCAAWSASVFAWINSRPDNPILIKFIVGYFYESLSINFDLCVDWTILSATLLKIIDTSLSLF
jgi:hypothetical protein